MIDTMYNQWFTNTLSLANARSYIDTWVRLSETNSVVTTRPLMSSQSPTMHSVMKGVIARTVYLQYRKDLSLVFHRPRLAA